jgi:single-strand DNA-binding protein
MAAFNQCTFIGRLGKDPDFSVTTAGTPLAKFSLAVDQYKGKAQEKETLWLNIVAWDRLAELVEKYTEKGRLVMVQGRLDINAYTDKEGVKRQGVQIVASSVQLLDSKSTSPGGKPTSEEYDPFELP